MVDKIKGPERREEESLQWRRHFRRWSTVGRKETLSLRYYNENVVKQKPKKKKKTSHKDGRRIDIRDVSTPDTK